MKASFENSVNVLVRAYLNNTLEHGSCRACAVGNLVAEATGKKLYYNENSRSSISKIEVIPDKNGDSFFHWAALVINQYGLPEKAEEEIDSTGYTVQQLRKIEKAFEGCKYSDDKDEWMLNGLYAVVDALAEIHNVDLSIKEEAKEMFVKC